MDAEVKGYNQWFAGKLNNLTDTLSQDWHQDNENSPNTTSPLPTTDADAFQEITAAQRDQLLADFATAVLNH
jgi:hypothetical protein